MKNKLILTVALTATLVGAAHAATLNIAGPNQWNNSGTSFGDAWEAMVKQYETLNPGVDVKTTVLPISSFYQTLSTQLQAGSAADLIFNQAAYKPSQVVALNDYLLQPNPYAPEYKRWIDAFVPAGFNESNLDTSGNYNWVPFNLVSVGLFVNEDAFAKAGVKLPLKTWEDWRAAVPKLKAAGYVPLAMDNSENALGWTLSTFADQLLDKYFVRWNRYSAFGKPGKAGALTSKSYARVLKSGVNLGGLPEMRQSLVLLKEVYDNATPNWSGIKPTSGAAINLKDFLAGKAAMAWAVNFAVSEIQDAKPSFKVGSVGWPTLTKATTALSSNAPARFGVTAGGTSYMIPASTKGENLKNAVRFLQYITSPKYNQPWLTASTGAAALKGVKAVDAIDGFGAGTWGEKPRTNTLQVLFYLSPQTQKEYPQILQGYLLGSASLEDTQKALQASWLKAADYLISQNPDWKSESWAK